MTQYAQTSPNLWSFVLSAPDPGSYIAMGFSADGLMVGSSAIVGWISSDGGGGTVKQYFLGGKKQNLVVPDQGNLQVVNNSTRILSQASRMYLVFQLRANQPSSRVLYAVGPAGFLPSAPSFELSEHRDKVSTSVNYVTGKTKGRQFFVVLLAYFLFYRIWRASAFLLPGRRDAKRIKLFLNFFFLKI